MLILDTLYPTLASILERPRFSSIGHLAKAHQTSATFMSAQVWSSSCLG